MQKQSFPACLVIYCTSLNVIKIPQLRQQNYTTMIKPEKHHPFSVFFFFFFSSSSSSSSKSKLTKEHCIFLSANC